MTEAEIQALADALAPVIKAHVEGVIAPALARVAVLEGRALVPGPAGPAGPEGPQGPQGADGMSADVMRNIAGQLVANAVGPLLVRVDQLEARAPIPGPQGDPGQAGRDAPSLDDLQVILADLVKAIPPAVAGKDGVGVAGALVDRAGHLVVTLSNGEQKDLGLVIGRDGTDGAAGRDAFGFDDLEVGLDDDGRTMVLAFAKGENVKEFRLALVHPIDRGVFAPGAYKRGDAVSWGGSMWIAQRDTSAPPESNSDWRLAVKRGRDGKDGVMKAAPVHTPVKVGQ